MEAGQRPKINVKEVDCRQLEFVQKDDKRSFWVKLGDYASPRAPNSNRSQKQKAYEFQCKECSETFSWMSHLAEHMRVHTGEQQVFNCEICSEEFTERLLLHRHKQTEHQYDAAFVCGICARNFVSRAVLESHMITVHSDSAKGSRLQCDFCQEAFDEVVQLENHRSLVHAERRSFMCRICCMSFYQLHELIEHKLKEHETQKQIVPDNVPLRQLGLCTDMSGGAQPCTSAERSSSGELVTDDVDWGSVFKCSDCPAAFSTEGLWQRHRLTRHGDASCRETKTFHQCDQCSSVFSRGVYLLRHKRRKHGEQFPCAVCGKVFSHKGIFQRHLESHERNKPAKCDICGNLYKDLKQHSLKHETGQNFLCELCGKNFRRKDTLKRHTKNFHSGRGPLFQEF